MTDHTPEPWMTPEGLHATSIYQRDEIGPSYARGMKIADTCAKGFGIANPERKANAERIVACVNACAGIPTEQLGDVKALANALEGMVSEWDKLTRYGSPMAKAANEQVAFARAALAPFRKD